MKQKKLVTLPLRLKSTSSTDPFENGSMGAALPIALLSARAKESFIPISCAVLMCHAPIVIPQVGGERGAKCSSTTRSMAQAAEAILQSKPDVLVVLSPHTPRARQAFAISQGTHLKGDMSRFGAPSVQTHLPIATRAVELIHAEAARMGVPTWRAPAPEPLDHGAAVPLIFAQQAGWNGQTVLVALPSESSEREIAFGQVLQRAADADEQRWALIASGDMSHRLVPGAPAGFNPRAHEFDTLFVNLLQNGDYQGLTRIDDELRALAAEDCVQTTVIAASAGNWSTYGSRFLNYEGPFGVGYSEAILYSDR